MFSAFDHAMMARALRVGERGRGIATPNPHVGCVLVKQGRILAEGWTQAGGRPHAEAQALAACSESPAGATAYVTLEPCDGHAKARGPACADLLVEAKVARVVLAVDDPFHGGKGCARLKAAGIAVDSGLMAAEAALAHRAFFSRVQRGRPWLTLKVATSLDGKTALANGASRWITGAAARRDVHRMRAEACAVMTGIGTALADDPQLTVRDFPTTRQPLRVLLDSRLDVKDGMKLLEGGNTLIITATGSDARQKELEARGIEVLRVPVEGVKGKVDLAAMMQLLASRGLNHILVETGTRLNASLVQAGVVDEVVQYVAPMYLGDASRGLLSLPEFTDLEQRICLKVQDSRRVGEDWRITALLEKNS